MPQSILITVHQTQASVLYCHINIDGRHLPQYSSGTQCKQQQTFAAQCHTATVIVRQILTVDCIMSYDPMNPIICDSLFVLHYYGIFCPNSTKSKSTLFCLFALCQVTVFWIRLEYIMRHTFTLAFMAKNVQLNPCHPSFSIQCRYEMKEAQFMQMNTHFLCFMYAPV